MLDRWDDMRLLLALAREGSLAAAGRALRVDPTTVARRMKALEASAGVALFDRLRGGVELTAAGELLVTTAEQWESSLHQASRHLEGGRTSVTGTVRLSVPELLIWPWMGDLTRFRQTHPELVLEVVADDAFSSLERREADVALRFTPTPPDHLIAKRLCGMATAVYASDRFDDAALSDVPWVAWDPREAPTSEIVRTHQAVAPGAPFVLYVNSYGLLLQALREGAGATMLPCVLGDVLPSVSRRSSPCVLPGHLWLLTHPDQRRSARIGAVVSFVEGLVTARCQRLLGR
ncbi:MAG: LysR family transcriptional regulator [Myxococcales bacterium]|nr:LysR family transcriptional regulator [Myxococcales bacterium]